MTSLWRINRNLEAIKGHGFYFTFPDTIVRALDNCWPEVCVTMYNINRALVVQSVKDSHAGLSIERVQFDASAETLEYFKPKMTKKS